MNAYSNPPAATQSAHRGFTLVELMVALLIALFLMGGMVTMVQAMRSAYGAQNGLSQLQDDQRMAMTFISNVIQSAGYFVFTPLAPNTAAGSLPALAPFAAAGQSVYGTGSATANPAQNTISVRYMTAGGDGIMNCAGGTSAVAATFINTFSIDTHGNLNCQVTTIIGGTTTGPTTTQLISGTTLNGTLVRGIVGMQIYYGVQTNPANATSVDTYLDAPGVSVTTGGGPYWMISGPLGSVGNVISVKVTLTFINPQYGQPGQTNHYIAFTRLINVMNKTGAST
jgi:type IV pilus assembly protein PilW